MAQCTTCGAGNPDNTSFCNNCGTILTATGPQSTSGNINNQPYGSPSGGYPPSNPSDYPPNNPMGYPPPGNYPAGNYPPPNPYNQPPNPYNQQPPNPYNQPPPNPYMPQVQINMGQPPYGAPLNRPQVSVGLCAVLSFFWSGAGFFLIPDRVGLAVGLVIATLVLFTVMIVANLATIGFGVFCTAPIGFTYWLGLLIWNIVDAQNYNQGRR